MESKWVNAYQLPSLLMAPSNRVGRVYQSGWMFLTCSNLDLILTYATLDVRTKASTFSKQNQVILVPISNLT